jgi:hypothetical protein
MRTVRTLTLALFTIALSLPIQAFQAAQSPVTAADLSRLENTAADIGRQVTALRKTDATLANDVDRTLGDLNDEITYLRVKMRKDGSVTREEYTALREPSGNTPGKGAGPEGVGGARAGRSAARLWRVAGRHRVRRPLADAAQLRNRQG